MSTERQPSLWALGGLGPIELGKRVWQQMNEDEVFTRSASLAYYFVLAVFPAMLFVLSIVGFLFADRAGLQNSLFSTLARVMPGSAADLVQKTLREVTQASGAGKAAFGILGALWSASQGVSAVMQSLNVAYEVPERRPWWKQRAIAIGLTLALAVLVLGALGLMLFGGRAAEFIGSHVGLGSALVLTWKIVQWPVVLAFMFAAFAVTYYIAPDLKVPEWHWITPGSALGLFCWLVASFALKVYLHFFNSYSKTYGSVGAVIILLLWLYITGLSILLGGEINDEIDKATNTKAQTARAGDEQEGRATTLPFRRPDRAS
jgi:membrane protein